MEATSLSLDGSILCEYAMNKIVHSMRYILSTEEENLLDCLDEIYVKRTSEINYVPFSKKDRLCIELLHPIAFADDLNGRTILLSYLQNSSLPIMKIICAFMNECFRSECLKSIHIGVIIFFYHRDISS